MFLLKTFLPCLYFAFLVAAPLPPPASPNTDACGPFNHQNDAGFNTCFSSVKPGGPAPYGIVCGRDPAINSVITRDSCASSAKYMCSVMALGRLTPGEWHWTGDGEGAMCRVGVFLSTDVSAAPLPNYRRCLNQIYQPMVLSCITGTHNVGSVNIKQIPDAATGFPGETVNTGYPAWIVAPMALYYSSYPMATPNVFGTPSEGFTRLSAANSSDPEADPQLAVAASNGTQGTTQAQQT
ncbi:MAG: hypothetical protein Q9166_001402 [cf. Caloplaca sp. 2 TL-2023]